MTALPNRSLWLLTAIAIGSIALVALLGWAAPLWIVVPVAATGIALIVGCAMGMSTTQRQAALVRRRHLRTEAGATPVIDRGGDAEALLASAIDLLQRLQASEAERTQLATAISNLEYGILAVDGDRRITLLNRRAARDLHLDPDRASGQRLWEVCRIAELDELLSDTFEGRQAIRREVALRGYGSRDRHLDLRASPVITGTGTVSAAVISITDISDLRRLETIRRDFVANVSHELKTPLTAIRGMVETVTDDEDMPPTTRASFLDRVLVQCARLSELVADLLTLSRVESAEGFERSPVDLAAVARSSLEHLRPTAEAKAIDLDRSIPGRKLVVAGDHESLRQVLDNLIDNAIKYTPSGGRVSVELEADGDTAVARVSDSGIGIAPAHLDRIFERFFRVDKARSRELGSTGLGLSIVKHVVAAHDGHIEVESRPGTGSTFEVRLPLADV